MSRRCTDGSISRSSFRSTRSFATCRWSLSRMPSARRCRMRTGLRPSTTACPPICFDFSPAPERILRSSAESRRKSASTARSRSPDAWTCRIKIAAKVDLVDRDYFETVIEPLLRDPLIEFVGEIGEGEKQEFLGNAYALLFPIDWPEPFGLVMIEGARLRHAGHRLRPRLRARGDYARSQRLHRRPTSTTRQTPRARSRSRVGGAAGSFSTSDSLRSEWPATI